MLKDMEAQLEQLKAKGETAIEGEHPAKTANLLSFYTRIMTKVTDSERCSVFIHDPEKDRVWLKAGTGVQEQEIEVPKEGSVVGKVIASGEPVVISGLEAESGAHKLADEQTGFVTRNILCVPIKGANRDEVTGAFQLLNKKNDKEFTNEDVSFALEVAEHLQREVNGIFLNQEAIGLSDRLFATARRTMTFLMVSIILVLLMSFLALVGSGILASILG